MTALLDAVLGIPTLRELGVTAQLVAVIARGCLDDPVIANTPRPSSLEEVEALLRTGC